MRLDEFQLAGAQPSPVQRAVPVQQQQQAVSAPSGFGEHIVSLLDKFKQMSPEDPQKGFLEHFLSSIGGTLLTFEEPAIQEATKPPRGPSSGATSNISYLEQYEAAVWNAKMEYMLKHNPQLARELIQFTESVDLNTEVKKDPKVKNAAKSAITGIQLNTKGEIGALDEDIETMAQQFADKFGVKLIWARNIVGMFGTKIAREDRQAFLQACLKGEALDINKMIKMGEGHIDECVTTKIPRIQDVYKEVKTTLLDISLSTGQRGATGPFEALLAIMGGARKPDPGEGGDVKLPDGRKFEVKSTSLSPTSKVNSKGELPATGSGTAAWLDSTAGGEISGAVLKSKANEWSATNFKTTSAAVVNAWKTMDFRPKGLPDLRIVFQAIDKKVNKGAESMVRYMMSEMFPNIVKVKGYDFNAECRKIVQAVYLDNPREIARVQGVMALLEYHLGKGNDGFIFFNSSVQEFKIFEGVKGILEVASSPGNVHFQSPMTMGKSQKCSPGIYYGPSPSSEVAKKYFKMYNSDPERVARRKAAAELEKQGKAPPDEGAFD